MLKVAVAGLCHSDLEYLKGTFPDITRPVTGSHEGTGVLIAKGSAVTKFRIGDRILAGQTFGRCGDCEICHGPENYRHYCPNKETMMSVHRNGAFQEYLVVDGREAAIIPDGMSFVTAAPLACAGMTSWRGVKQCGLKEGQWIAVVGSGGGLGHLAVQFAKKCFGLKVIGVDARDEGLALTKEVGVDLVVDAREGKEKVREKVYEVTDGKGVDAALCVSDAKSAVPTAGFITKDHGLVVQVALVSFILSCFNYPLWRSWYQPPMGLTATSTADHSCRVRKPILVYGIASSGTSNSRALSWRHKQKSKRCCTRSSSTASDWRTTSFMGSRRSPELLRC